MKVLKIIIGIVVVVAVLGVGYLAMLPANYKVERSTEINAPQELVAEHLAKFSEWENWSPWKAKDPDAAYTYEGEDGAVGSKMSWVTSLEPDNENQIGEGGMEITESSATSVKYKLWFVKPWEMTSMGGFNLSEEGGVTKITWYDTGDLPFMARPMGKMMDEMIGPDFDEGLAKLKAHVEEHAANMKTDYIVEEVEVESAPYYSITDSVIVEEIGNSTRKMMTTLMTFAGSNGIEIAGAPFTMYHSWDGKSTKMQCAIAVADNSKEGSDGISSGTTYAGKTLRTVKVGSYKNGEEPHNAIADFAEKNGIEIAGMPWEVYIAGPANEPDTTKWVTEIYYPIN